MKKNEKGDLWQDEEHENKGNPQVILGENIICNMGHIICNNGKHIKVKKDEGGWEARTMMLQFCARHRLGAQHTGSIF